MKKRKLVSIIIPTYNCADKIEKTVESILSQDRSLYEIIIVDGKSTDGTVENIKKYKEYLFFISETDMGIYDAMNKGIDLATGKYLFFLGAGDVLRKDVLKQIEIHLVDSQYNLIYGDVYMCDLDKVYNGEYNKFKLAIANICHQSIFYERNIFSIIGNYSLVYKTFADYVFNVRCFADPRINTIYINEVIADYEGGGVSTCLNDENFKKDFPKLISRNLGFDKYLYLRIRQTAKYIFDKLKLKRFIFYLIRCLKKICNLS